MQRSAKVHNSSPTELVALEVGQASGDDGEWLTLRVLQRILQCHDGSASLEWQQRGAVV